MIFTEYNFLLFFPLVFAVYWLVKRGSWQNILLLAASYIFYGWIHPWYALLLGLSTLADFLLARAMFRLPNRSRLFLLLSLILNLGVLAFFKYFNFFNADLAGLLSHLGLQADILLVQILLPAGLSFYTLKKLAYVIDVSRGTLEPTRDLIGFALFVSFFPQITAGPIDRAQKLLPQIQSERVWNAAFFHRAWPLLLMGFFKKIVIADTLRLVVDRVFLLREPSPFMLVTASLGFMIQILADFSAYTDLARAIALLFGFETSENFRAPYLALTPTDFWNRWHITLSAWLRDYLFFPLRRTLLRSRVPAWLTDSLPPLLTMLVSGIWHGAGWTYILWGLFFGALIVVYQMLGMGGAWQPSNLFTRSLARIVMFGLLLLTFILFRSPSIQWLGGVLREANFMGTTEQSIVALATLSTVLVYSLPLILKHVMDQRLPSTSIYVDLYYVTATILILFHLNSSTADFIYFRF